MNISFFFCILWKIKILNFSSFLIDNEPSTRFWLASWRTRTLASTQDKVSQLNFLLSHIKHKLSSRGGNFMRTSSLSHAFLDPQQKTQLDDDVQNQEKGKKRRKSLHVVVVVRVSISIPFLRSQASQCTIGEEKSSNSTLKQHFPFSFFSHSWTSSCGRSSLLDISYFFLLNEMNEKIFFPISV